MLLMIIWRCKSGRHINLTLRGNHSILRPAYVQISKFQWLHDVVFNLNLRFLLSIFKLLLKHHHNVKSKTWVWLWSHIEHATCRWLNAKKKSNSIVNTLELHLFCIKPWLFWRRYSLIMSLSTLYLRQGIDRKSLVDNYGILQFLQSSTRA